MSNTEEQMRAIDERIQALEAASERLERQQMMIGDGASIGGARVGGIPIELTGGGGTTDNWHFKVTANGDNTVTVAAGEILFIGNNYRKSVSSDTSDPLSDNDIISMQIDFEEDTGNSGFVQFGAGQTVPANSGGKMYIPLAKVSVSEADVAAVSNHYHVGDVILPFYYDTSGVRALCWDVDNQQWEVTSAVPDGEVTGDVLYWDNIDFKWKLLSLGSTYHVLQKKADGSLGFDVVRFPS